MIIFKMFESIGNIKIKVIFIYGIINGMSFLAVILLFVIINLLFIIIIFIIFEIKINIKILNF